MRAMEMVINPTVEPIDLLGCFYTFRPVEHQTVGQWCEQYGYVLEGDNEQLKELFKSVVVKTGFILSDLSMDHRRIEKVEDCFFE